MSADLLLVGPGEHAAMVAANETLQSRWAKTAEAIADQSGMDLAVVVHDLLMVGVHPDMPELADRDLCAAVIEGSVMRLMIVVGRIQAGVTIH